MQSINLLINSFLDFLFKLSKINAKINLFLNIILSFSIWQFSFFSSSMVYSLKSLFGSIYFLFLFKFTISFLIASFLLLIVSTVNVELKYKSTNFFSCIYNLSIAFSISLISFVLVELYTIISLSISYIYLVNSFKTLASFCSILSEL